MAEVTSQSSDEENPNVNEAIADPELDYAESSTKPTEGKSVLTPASEEVSPTDTLTQRRDRLFEEVKLQQEAVRHSAAVVAAKRKRLSINRENLERTRQEASSLESARDSLGTWLTERSRSLAVRLLDSLADQEASLERDERVIRAWAQADLPAIEGTADRLRRSFIASLWIALALALVMPVVLSVINSWLESEGAQIPILEGDWWRYVVLGAVVLFAVTLIGLIRYFRGYIRMKVQMNEMLARGKFLFGAVDQLRKERARITGLTPQVKERLEFLGAVLHEPWAVPGLGLGRLAAGHMTESLPANLQIASTSNADDPAIVRLRSRFIAEQFKPGLRRAGVSELLRCAGQASGIAEDQVDLRVIDMDVSTYGLRSALLTEVRKAEVLEMVGRSQVTRIASDIQAGLGPSDERPGIRLTNSDALSGLAVGHDLLSDWKQSQTHWDDYVVEILEDGAAMSRLAFSGTGLAEGRHTRFTSVAVAPERLHGQAGQLVDFVAMETDGVSSTEVSVRLDITEPMDVEHVALFAEMPDGGLIRADSAAPAVGPSAGDEDYTLA
jgi:hypothetical protein